MSVSILEGLMNAEINFKNSKLIPQIFPLAEEQLHNAIILLEKGYSIHDQVESLLQKHGDVDSVPNKKDPSCK